VTTDARPQQRTVIRYADTGADPVSPWTDACAPACDTGLTPFQVSGWDNTTPCLVACLPVSGVPCNAILIASANYVPGDGLVAWCYL
jgi:hypothetical protein